MKQAFVGKLIAPETRIVMVAIAGMPGHQLVQARTLKSRVILNHWHYDQDISGHSDLSCLG